MSWFSRLVTRRSKPTSSSAPILFTNSLSGKKEPFTPLKAGVATMYSCGPTVYSKAQVGNLRPYVFADTIARTLSQAGYRVRRVINITDVGHLQSDADEGEDKMEVGAKRENLSAQDIAARYARLFLEDIAAVGIDTRDILFPRATEYIEEQIAIVKILEEKGFTYRTRDGIYFDTSRFPAYGALDHGGSKLREEAFAEIGRRISTNDEKKHPADFALWKLSPIGSRRQQEWKSPWGYGFPGWHIECSAMSRALLGQPFDIHTGGMDHIPVHHTNEIAQSEAAFDKPLARYWLHEAFLTIGGEKISKSLGNDIYLSDVTERGFDALALRYLFLQAHYRSPISFSWESLAAADEALKRLRRLAREMRELAKNVSLPSDDSRKIIALLRDDLATPAALAFLWEVIKDEYREPSQILGVIEIADEVLGLGLLGEATREAIPADILALARERDQVRKAGNFTKSDELRIHIEERGYRVEDTPSGTVVTRRPG